MDDLTDGPLAFGPALLTWVAAAVRFTVLRRDPSQREQRVLCGLLVALACALTLAFPPIYLGLDRLVGVANLARLLSDLLAMTAALGLGVFLLLSTHDDAAGARRARNRLWSLAGTAAVMTALFLGDPAAVESVDDMLRYGGPAFALYRVVYLTFLGVTLADVMRRCWRSARQIRAPLVALTLRAYAGAAALVVLYLVHALSQLGIRWTGAANPLARSELVSQGLMGGAAVLVACGSTIPLWIRIREVPEPGRWVRTCLALHRLRPLWVALSRCSPEIVAARRRGGLADRLDPMDLDLRLYRRVVEIRDGYLSLRHHLDPAVRSAAETLASAAGLSGGQRGSTVEAAQLAAAVAAKATGWSVAAPDPLPGLAGGADLRAECAWLEQVAHAYTRSPIVRELARATGTARSPIPGTRGG